MHIHTAYMSLWYIHVQAVFRAPDLSSQFVEAMDAVVNNLLTVKDQELMDTIGEIAKDVSRSHSCVYVCGIYTSIRR